ncbi:DUF4132 domain-containing protein [Oceanirhabdus seepicola]|uniref:DUF4132 domain-containing protein n=1 Tax=Oceanirhabdus seepicola TaxID=2828781 RepID=A0A9J6NZW5_9CLOT|nr:DUF4132 domain-containing protein [Oceanirhabdus seepicola]MCM1988704.1 DUF4132 domain-containing protein [Oceanirhabdus seepicola]
MTKETIENMVEEFIDFIFFKNTNKEELNNYLLKGEGNIPNKLPNLKMRDIRYEGSFNVIGYLAIDFFEIEYNEKQIEIYKRWVSLLVKIIGKDILTEIYLEENINKLNWSVKEYTKTFDISFENVIRKQLKYADNTIDDKTIIEFLEAKGEKEVLHSLFKGNFSSMEMTHRINFASVILPFVEDKNKEEVLKFIKDNINTVLVENISSHKYRSHDTKKTDKEAIPTLENYFEHRNLKETVDILRTELHQKYGKYSILKNDKIKILLISVLKVIKIDSDLKYIIDLFQGVSPLGFLDLVDDVYDGKFDNLDQYKTCKKKFMEFYIEEKCFIAYGLNYVDNSFYEPKELIMEIIKYEGKNIKEAIDYVPYKLAGKICSLCLDLNEDEFYLNYARNAFYKTFKDYLASNCHYTKEYFRYYIWFLKDNEISDVLKKIDKNLSQGTIHNLTIAFLYIFDCKDNVQLFVKLLMNLDVNLKKFACTFAFYAEDKENSLRPVLVELLKYHNLKPNKKNEVDAQKTVNIFQWVKSENIEAKLNLLDVVFKEEELEVSHLRGALMFFKDKSKQVREFCAEKFSEILDSMFKCYLDEFKDLLNDSKEDIRLLAVKVLSNYLEIEEVKSMLEDRFKVETGLKTRNTIMELLNLDPSKLYVDENGEFDLIAYFQSLKIKKSQNVVDFSILPKVRLKGKEEYLSDEILNYFVKAYLNSSELKLVKDAAIVSNALNSEDLVKFSNGIYFKYLEQGIDSKRKGLILLAAVHGDFNTIENLNKLIFELASNSKHKLAQYTVKALVLNGSSHAFTIVNSIKNKYKYKSVKESAREAFQLAAKEFNMNIADLEDKIVPNLGFEGICYKEYDYGNRIIKVYLSNKLELEVENEKRKMLKNLPKASKDDIEERVEKAKVDFKNLKKELKNVKKLQVERLEEALLSFRTWDTESWKELFFKNPIMNRLGRTFVWGIYEGENLKEGFIYDEDIFGIDYDEIVLEEDMKIGLIHPLELEKEKLNLWKEILEENEVVQPFPQLTRTIYTALEDKEIIDEFKEIKINDAKLIKRFTDMGWFKGSVTDGGCYYEYYREWEELGIGVEITVDDYLDFYEVGYKDIAIESLEFYKAGTIERGSYVYDEVDKERRIHPKNISKRVYSEVIYSVYKALM